MSNNARPVASVHVSIQRLAKHVYRLQAKGAKALADWLVELTDCLVDGDPSKSEFGAELLAEAQAYAEAKAVAGRMGGKAKASSAKHSHSSAKHSHSSAKHMLSDAIALPSRPLAKPSQTDRQTEEGRIQDPVQGEDQGIHGSTTTREAA